VFQDEASARKAVRKLGSLGVPVRDCHVISAEGDIDVAKALHAAGVHDSAKAAYGEAVSNGHAVLAVRATYKPLMATRIVRDTLATFDTVDMGGVTSEHRVPDGPEPAAPSVLKDHPLFFTVRRNKIAHGGAPVSHSFGIPLLSKPKERHSAMKGGGFMSRGFWPMPLLSTKERKTSVMSGGGFMSRGFWPMPLVSSTPRGQSVIKGGDLPFSRSLGWPTLIRR
jgi:hypothetical protein